MKIIVISMWYNEAFLAPFFLSHYSYADEIRIVIDADTNDNSREICLRYPNVKTEEFKYPDMSDWKLHINKMNEIVQELDCDWIMAADADEFIFPETREHPEEFLKRQKGNLIYARIEQVYRHRTDADLDPTKPAIWQRRHGDLNPPGKIRQRFNKPLIVKPEANVVWTMGFHGYHENNNINICDEKFIGAHWKMADVDMAIKRRIKDRRERQGKRNLKHGWGRRDHHITEEQIKEECERHLDDSILF